jgi:hypothetical protein
MTSSSPDNGRGKKIADLCLLLGFPSRSDIMTAEDWANFVDPVGRNPLREKQRVRRRSARDPKCDSPAICGRFQLKQGRGQIDLVRTSAPSRREVDRHDS